MKNLKNVRDILSTALHLPVAIYRSHSLVSKTDSAIKNVASELLHRDPLVSIIRLPEQKDTVQYVSTNFGEHFLYYCDSENYELFVGPFLLSPPESGKVDQYIRDGVLSLNKKKALFDYYKTISVISEKEYFSLGYITQCVLNFTSESNEAPQWLINSPIISARAEQKFDFFEHPPYFLEVEMTRLITSGDVPNVLQSLDRINTFNRAKLAKDSLRSLKNSLICNCAIYARAAISGGVSPHLAFLASDALINEIEESRSVAHLLQIEKRSLLDFAELVDKQNAQKYSASIRVAILYINEHLSEKITLSAVANQVHISQSYLSRLFKQETGTTFSTYLQIRRIEESKFFLRYTNSPVSEIADFYQFCSQSHYIQCFKKHTHMTPTQFRNTITE